MTTIQSRHDTAANWTSKNPTLAAGEIGVETDTYKIKVGDGSTVWADLAYVGGSGGNDITLDSELSDNSTNPVQNQVITKNLDLKQTVLSVNSPLSLASQTIEITNSSIAPSTSGSLICSSIRGGGIYQFNLSVPILENGYYKFGAYNEIGPSANHYLKIYHTNEGYAVSDVVEGTEYNKTKFFASAESINITTYNKGLYTSKVSTLNTTMLDITRENAYYFYGSPNEIGIASSVDYSGTDTITITSVSKLNVLSLDTSTIPTLAGNNTFEGENMVNGATNFYGTTTYYNVGNFTSGLQYSGTEVAKADASNFTSAGTTTLSSYGMPSSRYTDLTFGGDGSAYTAPANGWITLVKLSGRAEQYCSFYVSGGISTTENSVGGDYYVRLFLPLKKGDVAHVSNNLTGRTLIFRFVYAEGAS